MFRYRTLFVALALGFIASAWASEGMDDVIKLSRAGLSQDVMLAFVQTSGAPYDLNADEIQKLRDGGVSATVIVAMIDHGKELRGTAAPALANTAPATNINDSSALPISQAPAPADNASQPTSDAVTVVAPPEHDVNVSFFYEALSPHGRWNRTALGWAWQPAAVEVEAGWRPYANGGHWVWTDQGWYWESTYPWGWAAFHYGRWNRDAALGWVWIPDTTWGPAWVSWRQGEQYYGWAPLPSEVRFDADVGFSFHSKRMGVSFDFGLGERDFTFVPAERFLDPELSVAIVSSADARTVYNRTTIVNNTYVYNNNRVINNGIPVGQVSQRTNRTIGAVRLADAHYAAGAAIRGEVRSRDTITVYRPAVAAAAPRDPRTAIAHSVYLRREAPAYPTVTAATERDAQRRLLTDVNQRSTPVSTSVAPSAPAVNRPDAREDAAQRRLDAELNQREHAERSSKAVNPQPSAVNEPAADRHDLKHTEKDAKKDKRRPGDD